MHPRATVKPAARRPAPARGGRGGGGGDRFPSAAAAAPRLQRGLRCDSYSRAASGVWYYQIDIEVRRVRSVDASASGLEPCDEDDVQYYSVRRRYNEFLQLYESIKDELARVADPSTTSSDKWQLPPFPQKELISSTMLGMLWRLSSPVDVLEDRRAKFEALLQWIEAHAVVRECAAFTDFLGQPPQSSEGYVSLKEYSSQHWLSSLEQLTKEKAKRRRLSSDCSSCSELQQERTRRAKKRRHITQEARPLSPSVVVKAVKRPRLYIDVKSPRKYASPASRAAKKRARASSTASQKDDSSAPLQLGLVSTEAGHVAQVESSNPVHKKKKI